MGKGEAEEGRRGFDEGVEVQAAFAGTERGARPGAAATSSRGEQQTRLK